jgi:acyl-coenzyme A synthetase/AMP-(fatty) acid ligase
MFHSFISTRAGTREARRDRAGDPRLHPAVVLDVKGERCAPGTGFGRLAVKGPTGVPLPLADVRLEETTFIDGWEPSPGDAYVMDMDGYFNLPGAHRRHGRRGGRLQHRRAEVEGALACRIRRSPSAAVVGKADEERGMVVAAFHCR